MKIRFYISILSILFCILCPVSDGAAELRIDAVYPTMGIKGQDLPITIKGSGFDAGTRVSMYPDIDNAKSVVGSIDTPGDSNGIAAQGNYAYVADGDSGLQIIDISIPSQPFIVSSVDTPGNANGVAVKGNYAYVADGDSGLQIIDISIPSQPFIVSSVDTPGNANGVAVSENCWWRYCAYVADGNSGLQIIDISMTSQPFISYSIKTADAINVAIEESMWNTFVYVADRSDGFIVINVGFRNGMVISSIPNSYFGSRILLTDNFFFL